MNKKAIVLLILVILWMGFIFYMSNSIGSESGSKSKNIIMFIVNKYDKITNASKERIEYHKSEEFIKKVNFYFRKVCHFSEYFILEILLFSFLIVLNHYTLLKCSLFSIGISILYAASDEFHQTFVNGRSGQIKDVLIDSSGAIIGTLLVVIIYRIIKKIKKSNQNILYLLNK